MNYIKKVCPACGSQFVVLENIKDKAVYCTLKCFLESQDQISEDEASPLLSS